MRKLFLAPIFAVLMCLGFMPTAQAETTVPDFFKNPNWWNQANPNFDPNSIYNESKWMYDSFPIACNNSTVNNRFRAYWVYPEDTTNRYPYGNFRKAIKAASSVFAATAHQEFGGTTGRLLKQTFTPRWYTEEDANGQCLPKVDSIAVPREVLTRPDGTGTWSPYQTGEVDDWMTDNGYRADNEKTVFLMQDFGHPNVGLKGVAETYTGTSETSWSPDPNVNRNNRGGNTLYIEYEPDYTNSYSTSGYWSEMAKTLAHEMTHSLGALLHSGEGSPVVTYEDENGHPSECYDVLCYSIDDTGTYQTSCGWVSGDNLIDQEESRYTYRLDCLKNEYFNMGDPAWSDTWWNIRKSSFLWANPQPTTPAGKMQNLQPNIAK